jgi:membrane-associated phospholipid phosphatase
MDLIWSSLLAGFELNLTIFSSGVPFRVSPGEVLADFVDLIRVSLLAGSDWLKHRDGIVKKVIAAIAANAFEGLIIVFSTLISSCKTRARQTIRQMISCGFGRHFDIGNSLPRNPGNARLMKKTVIMLSLIIYIWPIQSAYCRDYLKDAGDVLQVALPAAAAGATLYKKDFKGFVQFAEAFALAEIVTQGLKYTVRETRPNGGTMSFPSGHASSAFCGAAFLDMRYGEAWGVPAYVLAALTGWSRIESDNHYPWDVAAGAIIGVASNLIFTRRHIDNVKLVPLSGNGELGAAIVYRW